MRTGNKLFDNNVGSGRRQAASKLHYAGVQGEGGLGLLITSRQTVEIVFIFITFWGPVHIGLF